MLSAPHRDTTLADLLRVAACWLCAILLVQGVAAAHAMGKGPLHRHRSPASSVTALTLAAERDHVPQHHHHEGAERHHHAAIDLSLVPLGPGDGDADLAAFALTAALALMAFATAHPAIAQHRHVWLAARTWSWYRFVPALPRKPPRTA